MRQENGAFWPFLPRPRTKPQRKPRFAAARQSRPPCRARKLAAKERRPQQREKRALGEGYRRTAAFAFAPIDFGGRLGQIGQAEVLVSLAQRPAQQTCGGKAARRGQPRRGLRRAARPQPAASGTVQVPGSIRCRGCCSGWKAVRPPQGFAGKLLLALCREGKTRPAAAGERKRVQSVRRLKEKRNIRVFRAERQRVAADFVQQRDRALREPFGGS